MAAHKLAESDMFGWVYRKFSDAFSRSGRWASVRKAHLLREPSCVACGRSKEVEVHHIVPYHKNPSMELDPSNLITLCAEPCHFVHGHLMNWKNSNPLVREDAARYRERMIRFGVSAEQA